MRYLLYDAARGHVQLQEEVDYMNNYIELQQLKTAHKQQISFSTQGQLEGIEVAPMLLVTLLENSLKHSNIQQGGWINMHLETYPNAVHFSIENTLQSPSPATSAAHSGIGLSNMRQRLHLLYPDAHTFTIQSTETTFSATLRVTLP